MKNFVKFYKHFFGYFNALKTHGEPLWPESGSNYVDSKGNVLYGTKSRLVHATFYTSRKVPIIQSNCECFSCFIRKNKSKLSSVEIF